MLGIAVTAADCAGLQPGTSLQPGCGVCQISSPVSRSSACRPPPTLLSNRSAIDGLTGEICAPGTLGATTSNLTSDTAM
jgi:hypothetical protein